MIYRLTQLFPTPHTAPPQRVAKFEAQSQAQAQAQAKTKAQSAASAPTQAPRPQAQPAQPSKPTPTPTSEQSSRDQIFPLLVSELVSERILSATDGSKLRRLYAQEHPVINAAMDVYDVDGDIAELVDTLQRCVITSQ